MAARGPEQKVTDSEILDCIQNVDKPFVVTNDVASAVDLSGTRARQRLDRLVEEGVLEKRKVGRSQIYWLSDLGSN